MKKLRHITVNLTIDEYNEIIFIANKQSRTAANVAYMLIKESLENEILKAVNIHNSGFNKLQLEK